MAETNRVSFSVNLKWVVIILMVVIAGMLYLWKPWASVANSDRTIQVTGEAIVKAEPDEFVFYPAYDFKSGDKATALKDLSAKSDEVIKKLKDLGLDDSQIKTDSSGYDFPYYMNEKDNELTYTLRFTVTADSLEAAQKIQDYLLTTNPTGAVSPQPTFSDQKRKDLESQARDDATKDARAKADQSAKNLGFKVGKVKEVTDGQSFGGGPFPMYDLAEGTDAKARTALTVQPGENELNYSVTVTYFVR